MSQSGTSFVVPAVAIGGLLWIAHRTYETSKSGFGIGIGAGGGFLGVSVWSFLFGSPGSDGDGSGKHSGAGTSAGPLKEDPGGGESGHSKDPSDGTSTEGQGKPKDDSKGSSNNGDNGKSGAGDNAGEGKSGGGGGGVGGGSGGGVGSDHGSGTDGGVGEGGDKGEDDGGGEDEGAFEYDPFEGQHITIDLPPPDLSKTHLASVRGTVENLVTFSIEDPGADPDDAAKLPPALHVYNGDIGGILRFWADVALHYHYDLPWGLLDDQNPTHIPWIELWNDILALAAKLEWEQNGTGDEIPDAPNLFAHNGPSMLPRRGVGDSKPNMTLLVTRSVRPKIKPTVGDRT